MTKLPEHLRAKAAESEEKKYRQQLSDLKADSESLISITRDMVASMMDRSLDHSAERRQVRDLVAPIQVNVTPLCDYAQEKQKNFRILPGALVRSKYRATLSNNPGYCYVTDANIRIGDDDYVLLFDFRFLYAESKDQINRRLPKYRLKHQLLSDIQVKLSAHVNRSGVLYLA